MGDTKWWLPRWYYCVTPPPTTWTHPVSVKNIACLPGSSVDHVWTGVERDTHKTSHGQVCWQQMRIFVSSLGLGRRIQEGTCSKNRPSKEGSERKGSWCWGRQRRKLKPSSPLGIDRGRGKVNADTQTTWFSGLWIFLLDYLPLRAVSTRTFW